MPGLAPAFFAFSCKSMDADASIAQDHDSVTTTKFTGTFSSIAWVAGTDHFYSVIMPR